jgi:hypothetical protein
MTRSREHAAELSPRPSDIFRMSEFERVAASRSVSEILRANLEDAENQLQHERARAQRAQARADRLARAVENWHELVEDYERVTGSSLAERRN